MIKISTFALILITFDYTSVVNAWGHGQIMTENGLTQNRNETRIHFEKGFKPHTMKLGLRLRISRHNQVDILSLTSGTNKLSLKYLKDAHQVIFHINIHRNNKTSLWEIIYPNINLENDFWHLIVYRLGKLNLKLWVDCDIKKSANSDLKKLINIGEEGFKTFGNNVMLLHGDNDDILYNSYIEFLNHPTLRYSFGDVSVCKGEFHMTLPVTSLNKDGMEGIFYPLSLFKNVLIKHTSPGVYYEIKESTIRDVSEFFEDGLDKNHSFEMTYRIAEFPKSNYSYYLILLKSGAESQISLSLSGKRNILRVYSSSNTNGDLNHHNTEYWADEVYNNKWHTIKYTLENGVFYLWIDGELMEDFLGFTKVDLKYSGVNQQYLWFDTALMIMEPESGLHKEPVLHIRHMKFNGHAVTSNNTEISLEDQIEPNPGFLDTFFRVVGRKFS